MQLSTLIKGLDFIEIKGDINKEISSIAYDSRKVIENSVFVAISGYREDGHAYINEAIKKGASAIILEKDIAIEGNNITILKVQNSRKALAKISSNYYHNPSDSLNIVGITGTNGKTSITYLVKSIFEQTNRPTSLIGTIGSVIGDQITENKNTTPESLELQRTFSEILKYNIETCIMEVSSHALSLHRVAACSFNTGVFTNLTPDHLELHKSMDEYFNAKAELFKMTKDYNVVNADDEYGIKLIKRIKNYETKLITYGIENKADIYATDIRYSVEGVKYVANTPKGSIDIHVNIPGTIYVYNSLAAIACAYCNNIDLIDIQKGINAVKYIKGRFEIVPTGKDYTVIIDFAHTEDALEKALTTIKQFAKGRIILVFGVYAPGAESGKGKRRGMGKVAAKYADLSIVTSDNPKRDNPELIIADITESIEEENGDYVAIIDRKKAIRYAIENSRKDDVILIAGKGHETTQIIGDEAIPFNEKEIVIELVSNDQKTS
ncbi:UDP-N-acetylmuramoylalanyl-D-glutamate--2,6-diaminopimelate ligase [Natronincola peptidivorans]|uniref:UDP-N-acetylmuramyl-tripeptide synthetase n=1 Tax=Natronincola peptidivorans TaxID=426128 RepID=A0A1H9YLR0_9FIRM|nr:UDP-N-acetylmuramoyl-L-alanyl-D-glutamate--2,6-diaminopimelate ligase [Natronincola peptidivorans]SES69978.1 UDP-N-acetylmuramoylalanyl-D-glutamate--2,6-diaminopimelate ligase [Natronincola peptidivorans]